MKVIVVVGSSHKSWAYGIERAENFLAQGHTVSVLDFSRVVGPRYRSFKKRSFENQFYKERNLLVVKLRRISFDYIFSWLKVSFYVCKFFFSRKLFTPNWGIYTDFILASVRCRLAQTLGSREFPDDEIPIRFLKRFLISSLFSSLVLKNYIEEKVDLISLFNGREPLEAVLIRGCIDREVKVEITERASNDARYEVYKTSPHYQPEWWSKSMTFWEDCGGIAGFDKSAAHHYLVLKTRGFDSFTGRKWGQFLGSDNFVVGLDIPYILFFATSTHEFSPISEFESNLGFQNQFEALDNLISVAKKRQLAVVVKRHPNSLSPLDGKDREKPLWDKYLNEKCQIIGPRARVNAHELAKSSIACFVWRSSIGVETLALGVPTYALGSARWALDEEVRTWSTESISKVLESPSLPKHNLLEIYSNYMANGGTPLSVFDSVNRNFAVTKTGIRIYDKFMGRQRSQIFVLLGLHRLTRIRRI